MLRKLFGQPAASAALLCSDCGRTIPNGERYWSVQYAVESFDGASVEVHDAAAVALYCAECAAKRDFEQIQVPLKQ